MSAQPKRPRKPSDAASFAQSRGYVTKLKGDSEPFYVRIGDELLKVRWETGRDADGNKLRRLTGVWERDSG